ncbi:hypothetical protein CK203_089051 [Vitis vinifera]|uniref:Reverse transcriptase domain-containing protein n=1 Tax=Vitis vinifera TaxID=29760 RepID=A0A438F5N2_VITVI|nr:hypothetical protein CK203_089051 [Vitis vinifera]
MMVLNKALVGKWFSRFDVDKINCEGRPSRASLMRSLTVAVSWVNVLEQVALPLSGKGTLTNWHGRSDQSLGRKQILDAVLIANELVHEKRRSREKGVVFKIDFEKACGHVD